MNQSIFSVFISIKAYLFFITFICGRHNNNASGLPVVSRSVSATTSFMGIPIYYESIPLQIVSPHYDLMSQILAMMMTNMAISNQNNQTSIPNASMNVRILPIANLTGRNFTSGNMLMIPAGSGLLQSAGKTVMTFIDPAVSNSTRQVIRSIIFPSSNTMNFSMMAMGSTD